MKKVIIILSTLLLISTTTIAATIFKDVNKSDLKFAQKVTDAKLMSSSGDKFFPTKQVTRMELAKSLSAVQDKLDAQNKIINQLLSQEKYEDKIINIATKTLPSVVEIARESDGWIYGTGFVIKGNLILTNSHVITGSSDYVIKTITGTKYKATVLKNDSYLDLALLKIDEVNELPYLELTQNAVKVGQSVISIGNPLNYNYSTHFGIVSNVSRSQYHYQLNIGTSAGSSGSPVISLMDGKVIGMVYGMNKNGQDLSFAIKYEVINRFLSMK